MAITLIGRRPEGWAEGGISGAQHGISAVLLLEKCSRIDNQNGPLSMACAIHGGSIMQPRLRHCKRRFCCRCSNLREGRILRVRRSSNPVAKGQVAPTPLTRVRRRPHWPAARPRAVSRHGVHLQLTRGIHLQRSQVRRPHRVKQLSRADSCSALRCPQDANPTIPPAEANARSEVLTYDCRVPDTAPSPLTPPHSQRICSNRAIFVGPANLHSRTREPLARRGNQSSGVYPDFPEGDFLLPTRQLTPQATHGRVSGFRYPSS